MRLLDNILLTAAMLSAIASAAPARAQDASEESFQYARMLYDKGMYEMASGVFRTLGDPVSEGWAILCDAVMRVPGYENRMGSYLERHGAAGMGTLLNFRHALNLFDGGDYKKASGYFAAVDQACLPADSQTEFTFKRAWCDFENGDYEAARYGFRRITRLPYGDYTAPSAYACGYMAYEQKRFDEALDWFRSSARDSRFEEISNYYIIETNYMKGDYAFVTKYGTEHYDKVPDSRKPHLARLVSESFLSLGQAGKARDYYEKIGRLADGTRGDWFYAGSVMYASGDWRGAIDNYSMMTDRSDSLGQIASYNMASSYLKLKDKISAKQAFREAAAAGFDKAIAKDAAFNYAKLAFDVDGDKSGFDSYLKQYPDASKNADIYSYIALAALSARDYAGAVEAYDKIDDLTPKMRSNYMKANYLRAQELIAGGSWRKAVPCLKAAAYYSDRQTGFNRLCRYWLAEAYFRDDDFAGARGLYNDLYNVSALDTAPEGKSLPYNIAWCYFKEKDYAMASKWFGTYISSGAEENLPDALVRKADCSFVQRNYPESIKGYAAAISAFPSSEDLYPYYQSAMAYGFGGDARNKAKMLSKGLQAPAGTPYRTECVYELGRTSLSAGNYSKARECFSLLVSEMPDSVTLARSLVGMGMVEANAGNYDAALEHYKRVVSMMPGTDYSKDALLAIESIYQTKQEPEKFLAYIESIGSVSGKTDSDKEDILFSGAVQACASGSWLKAEELLGSYLERYPKGRHLQDAWFHMGEANRGAGRLEQACDWYLKVLEGDKGGSYYETACSLYSKISFDLQKYPEAYSGYGKLLAAAKMPENVHIARAGLMRSAYGARDYAAAVSDAGAVIADPASNAEEKEEALYLKAKSCLHCGRRKDALTCFRELSANPASEFGAEAAYVLITDSYDRGDFEAVKNAVYAFSDSGTPQTYWLAKSFILLGDAFMETGDARQAKATFESVLNGYTAPEGGDDVIDAVKMRLGKIK